MSQNIIKSKLFDRSVAHYMKVYGYPPCTAKIVSYLLLDVERAGTTFDQITELFGMSKSTASEALQLLLRNKHIIFEQKADDRKRYFKINPDFILIRYQMIFENLSEEKAILDELRTLMKKNPHADGNRLRRVDVLSKTLSKSLDNLQSAIENLKTIKTTN